MRVFLPETTDALWAHLCEEPEAALYAGGTDLLVKVRSGLVKPSALICLERLSEIRGVREEGEEIFIGACTTHTALLESPVIEKHFPVLKKAVSVLGSPPIRHMATIGGNICTASPAGDTLPPLYLLGAELELWAQAGTRRVALEQFISGPGRTAISGNEILAGVRLKKGEEFNIHHFEKVGQRKALAISIASLTALVRVTSSGIIEKIRLAWGSVGPTIVTSKEAEKALTGLPLTVESLRCAFPFINDAVSPISDIRASAAYRKAVSANLALRLAQYGPRT